MTEAELADSLELVLFEGAPAVRDAGLFVDIGPKRFGPSVSIRGGTLVDTTSSSHRESIVQPFGRVFSIYERYFSEAAATRADISTVELKFHRDRAEAHFSWTWRVLRLDQLRAIREAVDPLLADLRCEARSTDPESEYVSVNLSVPPARTTEKRLVVANSNVASVPLTVAQERLLMDIRRIYLEHDQWLYETRLDFHRDTAEDDHWTGMDLISTGFLGDTERNLLDKEAADLASRAAGTADDAI